MAVTRRPATEADEDLARRLHHLAYREVVERQFGPWDEQAQDGFFAKAWSGKAHELVLWNGEPCGFAAIEFGAERVDVHELVVEPASQGRGIGSAVLQETTIRAAALGAPVHLQVLRENRAVELYRRFGFVQHDETDTHLLLRLEPSTAGAKAGLVAALGVLNRAALDKLADLDEYDLRRPLTPTGTNLLGVVKHLASVQAGYFGDVFDRPWPEPMPWLGPEAAINEDLYATPAETSESIRDFYRQSWAHATETFVTTDLDATGTVAWWPPERRHPTLQAILVHMTVETARHTGHLDLARELIDGQAGRFPGDPSLPGSDEIDWVAYWNTVDTAARAASGVDPVRSTSSPRRRSGRPDAGPKG
ncbi:MAG: GNAT family N-acetyltransferase [Actinomycetota bacterium]